MTAILLAFWAVCAGAGAPEADLAILAAKIVPMEGDVIDHGILLVKDGKIAAMGARDKLAPPAGATVIDAGGHWLMPGIVEAHSHIGLAGGLNDMVYPLNQDLNTADCIDLDSAEVRAALAEGVTCMNSMPGSGTNCAGFSVIFKLAGAGPDAFIVRDPGCLKVAQAFNPERNMGDMGATRMGMAFMLRRLMEEGRAYTEAWRAFEDGTRAEKPALRRDLERVRMVFEGKVPVINHTYSGWGVAEAIRLFSDEFGLDLIATHTAYGGFQVGKIVAMRPTRVHVNIGPRLVEYGRTGEGVLHAMGAEYWKRGVRNLSINTDAFSFFYSRLSPQQHLFYQASLSARYGLGEEAAMHAVTIAPARALKIDDRVGSLKVGKDADLVLKRGALLDVTAPVDMVIIDGNIVFEREDSGIVVRAAAGEGGAPAPQDAQGYAPETGTEVRAAANGHAGGSARREVKS